MSEITHADKIACIRREIAMRRNVYPKWIAAGRMTQDAADRELATMQAVHDDIERLPKLERLAEIAPHLDPNAKRSVWTRFRDALAALDAPAGKTDDRLAAIAPG